MNNYLLTASDGLQLISFPDFKPILKFGHDKIEDGANFELDVFGNGIFLKSSYSQFKFIGLVDSGPNIGKFKTVQEFDTGNAVCNACPKSKTSPVMAIGLSDGTIMLTRYETQAKIAILRPKSKSTSDNIFKCLKHLDFNSDHSQLVSVFEEDFINVFDIHRNKLAFEIKDIKNDEPTLAKFSPNIAEPHLMCIGYTSGRLKLYDTCVQKLVHKSKKRHFNMCKDLCFFNTKQSCVISVGYDSSVLIHDFRSSTTPNINFLSDHHLNTVAISGDDNYYCIGDYKGNLKSYDMRKSIVTPLSATKISARMVTKIIFLQSTARKFIDETIHTTRVEPVTDKTFQQVNKKRDSTFQEYDSFFNIDVINVDEPVRTSTEKNEDLDDLKCENQFIQNIRTRSTCLFEQPMECVIKSPSPPPADVPNTLPSELIDVTARIDNYETQLKEMNSQIHGLKSMVAEMNKFIGTFPEFLEAEIRNLRRKYREEDMLLVEKLSIMCASDPQIVELTNYVLKRHQH